MYLDWGGHVLIMRTKRCVWGEASEQIINKPEPACYFYQQKKPSTYMTIRFTMSEDGFRDTVSREAGAKFPPEAGRYLLFVSHSCPWAQGSTIARELKGLQDIIELYEVDPVMGPEGWYINPKDYPGNTYLLDLYKKQVPNYSRRATVPTLYDKKTQTFVNNESLDIVRIFNTEFNDLLPEPYKSVDLRPSELQQSIDEESKWIIDGISKSPMSIGLTKDPEVAKEKKLALAGQLKRLDEVLETRKYILGDKITELDVRAFPGNVRYDLMRAMIPNEDGLIKSIRQDYPNIERWLKDLYWENDAFKSTTRFDDFITGMKDKPFTLNDVDLPTPYIAAK